MSASTNGQPPPAPAPLRDWECEACGNVFAAHGSATCPSCNCDITYPIGGQHR